MFQFLQDLLDSLFNILLQNNNSELCDDLVFDALVSDAGTENKAHMLFSACTCSCSDKLLHTHSLAPRSVCGLDQFIRDGMKELGMMTLCIF